MYEVECCLGSAVAGGSLMLGSYFYFMHSLEFSVSENRRVEARYKELCKTYEGKDEAASEFRKEMLSMFKEAKRRAAEEGWFVTSGTRKRLKRDWQADINVLEGIDPSTPGSYIKVKNVFKKTGQWNDDYDKTEKSPH